MRSRPPSCRSTYGGRASQICMAKKGNQATAGTPIDAGGACKLAPHVVRNRSVAASLLEQGQGEESQKQLAAGAGKKMRHRDGHRMEQVYRWGWVPSEENHSERAKP